MKAEDLMKPRYKAIAHYPESTFYEGEVLTLPMERFSFAYAHNVVVDESFFNEYQHLFKKLAWWEDREESEMPEYVKLVMFDKIQFVHKVEEWIGLHSKHLYSYYNKAGYLTISHVSSLLPATEEEFYSNNKINNMNKKETIANFIIEQLEKIPKVKAAYSTKYEMEVHVLSGEVTIPATDVIEYILRWEDFNKPPLPIKEYKFRGVQFNDRKTLLDLVEFTRNSSPGYGIVNILEQFIEIKTL